MEESKQDKLRFDHNYNAAASLVHEESLVEQQPSFLNELHSNLSLLEDLQARLSFIHKDVNKVIKRSVRKRG